MGKRGDGWWSRVLFRGRGSGPGTHIDGGERPVTSIDTALVIEAARHVVTTRIATQASLSRHLHVSVDVADQLLAKLEHCEVVGAPVANRSRQVIPTAGELPALVEEFRRRG